MATINGTSGNDTLNGTTGNDTIYGYEGDDYIDGGDGFDIIYGGDGDDYLTTSTSATGDHNELHGEAGEDTLYGGAWYSTGTGEYNHVALCGGEDNDTYIYTVDAQRIQIDETSGTGTLDTLSFGAGISLSNLSF